MSDAGFEAARVPEEYDNLAPDGSEIRHLVSVEGGNLVHCTLPPGGVSRAHRHRTVEELWYVLAGEAEVWRSRDDRESVVAAPAGTALTIPTGVHFQFRTVGDEPLELLIATIPPWPGHDEAVRVDDRWEPTDAEAARSDRD